MPSPMTAIVNAMTECDIQMVLRLFVRSTITPTKWDPNSIVNMDATKTCPTFATSPVSTRVVQPMHTRNAPRPSPDRTSSRYRAWTVLAGLRASFAWVTFFQSQREWSKKGLRPIQATHRESLMKRTVVCHDSPPRQERVRYGSFAATVQNRWASSLGTAFINAADSEQLGIVRMDLGAISMPETACRQGLNKFCCRDVSTCE